MKAYYFGVWTGSGGHYLHGLNGSHVYRAEEESLPWEYIDGQLQPHHQGQGYSQRDQACDDCRTNGYNSTQHQGESLLHFKDGWNALSMWDSSQDERGACNSTFIFNDEGREIPFEEMVELAKKHFSVITDRFPFEIQLVDGC